MTNFKRGADFEVTFPLKAGEDLIVIDPLDMKMQVRQSLERGQGLIAELDIASGATAGHYVASYDGDTSAWPLGIAYYDARVIIDEKVRYTNTETITIIPAQTKI